MSAIEAPVGPSRPSPVFNAEWDDRRECWTLYESPDDGGREKWYFTVDQPEHSNTRCCGCGRKILEHSLRLGYPTSDVFSADGVRTLYVHEHCLAEDVFIGCPAVKDLCGQRSIRHLSVWLGKHVHGFDSLKDKKQMKLAVGFRESMLTYNAEDLPLTTEAPQEEAPQRSAGIQTSPPASPAPSEDLVRPFTRQQLDELSLPQLRKCCEEVGVSSTGKRGFIVSRIMKYQKRHPQQESPSDGEVEKETRRREKVKASKPAPQPAGEGGDSKKGGKGSSRPRKRRRRRSPEPEERARGPRKKSKRAAALRPVEASSTTGSTASTGEHGAHEDEPPFLPPAVARILPASPSNANESTEAEQHSEGESPFAGGTSIRATREKPSQVRGTTVGDQGSSTAMVKEEVSRRAQARAPLVKREPVASTSACRGLGRARRALTGCKLERVDRPWRVKMEPGVDAAQSSSPAPPSHLHQAEESTAAEPFLSASTGESTLCTTEKVDDPRCQPVVQSGGNALSEDMEGVEEPRDEGNAVNEDIEGVEEPRDEGNAVNEEMEAVEEPRDEGNAVNEDMEAVEEPRDEGNAVNEDMEAVEEPRDEGNAVNEDMEAVEEPRDEGNAVSEEMEAVEEPRDEPPGGNAEPPAEAPSSSLRPTSGQPTAVASTGEPSASEKVVGRGAGPTSQSPKRSRSNRASPHARGRSRSRRGRRSSSSRRHDRRSSRERSRRHRSSRGSSSHHRSNHQRTRRHRSRSCHTSSRAGSTSRRSGASATPVLSPKKILPAPPAPVPMESSGTASEDRTGPQSVGGGDGKVVLQPSTSPAGAPPPPRDQPTPMADRGEGNTPSSGRGASTKSYYHSGGWSRSTAHPVVDNRIPAWRDSEGTNTGQWSDEYQRGWSSQGGSYAILTPRPPSSYYTCSGSAPPPPMGSNFGRYATPASCPVPPPPNAPPMPGRDRWPPPPRGASGFLAWFMTAERSNSVSVVAAAGATWDRPRQCWTLPAEVPVGATETWRFNVDSSAHSRTHCIACERKILENDLRVGFPAEDKFSADGVRSLFLHVHCLPEELVSNDATLAELCRDRDSTGVQAWLAGHVVGFESLAKKKKAMLVQGFCETLVSKIGSDSGAEHWVLGPSCQPPAVNKSPKKTPAVMESDEQPASCRDDELSKRGSSQDRVNLSYADVCEPTTELTPVDRVAGDVLRELTVETPGLPDCGNIGTSLKDRSSKYLGAWRLNSDGPSSANSAAADREYHYITATGGRQETKYLGSWRTEGAPSPISSRYPVGAPVRLVPSYRSKGKGYHSKPYWGRGNTHGRRASANQRRSISSR